MTVRLFTARVVLGATLVVAVCGCAGKRAVPTVASSAPAAATVTAPAVRSAVAPAPACDPSRIALTYRGGGLGTGNDFGEIVLSDIGSSSCRIAHLEVTVTPLDRAGRVIATPPSWVRSASADGLVLSAHGGPPRGDQGSPPGNRWAAVLLGGAERDDPRAPGALCAARNEVTPYAWRVTGTFSATVRNVDAYLAAHPMHGSAPSLYACADPDLALLNVDITEQP